MAQSAIIKALLPQVVAKTARAGMTDAVSVCGNGAGYCAAVFQAFFYHLIKAKNDMLKSSDGHRAAGRK